jgi:malate dehydrogenase (oxaloacetate-decarboxylating)
VTAARDEMRRLDRPAEAALHLHPYYRGKVQVLPKCPIRVLEDFAVWYTPGVAAPSLAIARDPAAAYEHTNRANSVAIVSDGSRVLGLGDIGPAAALPVMEGKALLFKYLGGVDAVPLCVAARDADELVRTVEVLEPTFGAINLEDISQPKCFAVLDRLRSSLSIPVWHDDQQGTATVVLAGLLNALTLVGKDIAAVRLALIGFGAANVATYRLLKTYGVDPAAMVACDRGGVLHRGRHDIEDRCHEFPDKWLACQESNGNGDGVTGGIREALAGADVCIAFAHPGPGVIQPEWLAGMRSDAIVFACANPVPEIWPEDAEAAGARIIATGRSDLPNQLNNSLGFPGIFRGVLDVGASAITDEMAIAAAHELARYAATRRLDDDHILPTMAEWEVFPRVAVATARAAQTLGITRLQIDADELYQRAYRAIRNARESTHSLMREGLIPPMPRASE